MVEEFGLLLEVHRGVVEWCGQYKKDGRKSPDWEFFWQGGK
jgi:hypothetical protein